MKRFHESTISEWYKKSHRKPLVIRGARQVGKSTLVRMTAQRLNLPLWEINLERYSSLNDIFGTFKINDILTEISIVTGISDIGHGPGILFLDEIQATPKALAALRYFFEDRPDIAVIAAGSLLEFLLADFNFSMPVGRVEYLWLGPVSFDEYLKFVAPEPVFNAFNNWRWKESFSENLHKQLIGYFRNFILCGGMPEAASIFNETSDMKRVQQIHRSILETYRDDFGKYAGRTSIDEIRRVFSYIPSGVSKKIRWSEISPESRSYLVKKSYNLLINAGIVLPVVHSDSTGIPLSSSINEKCQKPLFLDVGLMQTALGVPLLTMENFLAARFINEGSVAEQIVGQELYFGDVCDARPQLHYWLRESKSTNAEVDYIITINGKVIPIEVKSGSSGTLRSLHQFIAARSSEFALRFDLNSPSTQQVNTTIITSSGKQSINYELRTLPLYFAGRVRKLFT